MSDPNPWHRYSDETLQFDTYGAMLIAVIDLRYYVRIHET
jgi:hypothetical protein